MIEQQHKTVIRSRARPIRMRDFAMWVCEQVHMECWGEGPGTVPVELIAQEKSVGVMGILAGVAVGVFVRLVRLGV
uniref:Uncharacterized protein n=1 Tax=Tanacetum cinerariifolium TaxID=118510 RepID=A0A6L2KW90_TANCI|nr:hypothetical protein [Tanacetum cinerariifolium]